MLTEYLQLPQGNFHTHALININDVIYQNIEFLFIIKEI